MKGVGEEGNTDMVLSGAGELAASTPEPGSAEFAINRDFDSAGASFPSNLNARNQAKGQADADPPFVSAVTGSRLAYHFAASQFASGCAGISTQSQASVTTRNGEKTRPQVPSAKIFFTPAARMGRKSRQMVFIATGG